MRRRRKMKRIISGVIALTLLASLGLAGASCVPIVQAKTGTIEVRVTDAPPGYDVTSIEVTVSEESVEARRAVDDGKGDWEPIDIIAGNNPFDLSQLEGGLQEVLAMAPVPAGKYTQIRMNIEMVEVTYTYLEDGVTQENTVEAIIPSGELKFVRPFDVVEGETTTLLLDFIADESVVVTGAVKDDKVKVIFKPVVKLSIEHGEGEEEEEEELLGTIAGTVTDSSDEPIEGANVVVEGTELSATTDGNGDYEIDDVPVGTYTVTASAEGYKSASQENVEVSDNTTSTVNFTLEPSA